MRLPREPHTVCSPFPATAEDSAFHFNWLTTGELRKQYDAFVKYVSVFRPFYEAHWPEVGNTVLSSASTGILIVGAKCELPSELRLTNGARVVATDIALGMLQRQRAQDQGQFAHKSHYWVQATYDKLPFADGSFDMVYSAHIVDLCCFVPEALLREMKRVVKKEGVILVAVMEKDNTSVIERVLNWVYTHVVFRLSRPLWQISCNGYAPHSLPVSLEKVLGRIGLRTIARRCSTVYGLPVSLLVLNSGQKRDLETCFPSTSTFNKIHKGASRGIS